MKKINLRYENDDTPSIDIVRKYREVVHLEDHDANLSIVTYRGGEEEFLLGKNYCMSDDPWDRVTGADILGQLGWSDQSFRKESIEILIGLLADLDDNVIEACAMALGHRSAKSAIPELLKHVDHSNPNVRYGITLGLLGHEQPEAIEGLIKLCKDDDRDVRNWATFGIGTQIESDSDSIRETLREALCESDNEIRGEALLGLAKRGDDTIVQELFNEWRRDEVSILSIEAAEETRDPRLFQRLKQFTEILTLDDDVHFSNALNDAILACTPKLEIYDESS